MCNPGYTGSHCEFVDQCTVNHGGCEALTTCANTPGGRTCGQCSAGYDGDGETGCIASPH